MPRNMSFMLTTEQIKNRTKTVTRRLGWKFLKVGDILNAVEKCQGLKKGEKIKRLCQIRVVNVRGEPLRLITKDDCVKEGFPNMSPWEFVAMFEKEMKCKSCDFVTRIEFEYL
jgi:hypothetical protein